MTPPAARRGPSGRWLVLMLVVFALAIAALRLLCFPAGSFREELVRLRWGTSAESVREALGEPDVLCTTPTVAHLELSVSPDTAAVRRALASATAERWVYARPRPTTAGTRDRRPDCRAPTMAAELGFDAAGRLRWYVREADQTPVVYDPTLVP